MKDADRQTRSRLMRLFEQQDRQPRHDLGQNFLVDLNLLDLIVKHAQLSSADVVLEVGTGTGGLTSQLAARAGHVISVEFDEHVHGHAQRLLADQRNVTLIHGDALASKHALSPMVVAAVKRALRMVGQQERADFGPKGAQGDAADDDNPWVLRPAVTSLKLVANLPYNIATPVMSNLVASDFNWSSMVVTIQFELAERMLARPNSGDYSALTVWLQSQAKLKLIRKLPPSVFWPPPKVDSAVLRVERWREGQSRIVDRDFFHNLVRDIFTLRRKQILGVLTQMFDSKGEQARADGISAAPTPSLRERLGAILSDLKIPPTSRPEQLAVEQFIQLSNSLIESALIPQTRFHTP